MDGLYSGECVVKKHLSGKSKHGFSRASPGRRSLRDSFQIHKPIADLPIADRGEIHLWLEQTFCYLNEMPTVINVIAARERAKHSLHMGYLSR